MTDFCAFYLLNAFSSLNVTIVLGICRVVSFLRLVTCVVQLPPPVRARKLAEEHFYFKPFDQQEGWTFPDVEITKDTPADYCVEFNCQLPTSPARAAFVRLYATRTHRHLSHTEAACRYPMADAQGDGGIISSIADEIEKCAPVVVGGWQHLLVTVYH
jgi:hypothetical protein